MSQEKTATSRRGRLIGWLIIAVLVILVLSALLLPPLFRNATTAAPSATPSVGFPTPVPQTPSVYPTPTPGTTETAAPSAPVEVGIDETAKPAAGIVARVAKLESVQGVGDPGETSGPAIRVTVVIDNESKEALSLAGATVNMSYGPDDKPAPPVSKPGVIMFPTSVEAGGQATGAYVFTIPVSERNQIRITLDLSATVPMVVFTGVGPK